MDAERYVATVLLSVAGAVKPMRTLPPILSTQGALTDLPVTPRYYGPIPLDYTSNSIASDSL